MAEKQVPGGFLGAGFFLDPSMFAWLTLSQVYDHGTVAADQTLVLTDAHGGGVVIDGSSPGFTGTTSFYVNGNSHFGGGQAVSGIRVLVGASPYSVVISDYILEVQSNGGAITINLPALTGGSQVNGRIIIIKDSGYNAAVANITVAVGNAADQIENGGAGVSYIINLSGSCIWLKANTTNNNWEIL
jgi:hypothetical protein